MYNLKTIASSYSKELFHGAKEIMTTATKILQFLVSTLFASSTLILMLIVM